MKKEEECVTEMLTGGQIEPSDSPWSSPVVLVTKKDGGSVDYRKLNDATVKDAVTGMCRCQERLEQKLRLPHIRACFSLKRCHLDSSTSHV